MSAFPRFAFIGERELSIIRETRSPPPQCVDSRMTRYRDAGYTNQQIARMLNVSLGEVNRQLGPLNLKGR